MPNITAYQATTQRLEILSHDGNLDAELMPQLSDAALVKMMELMIRMRIFDEKAINLQRQGRIGTFGSLKGQEAAQTGLALALREEDWLIPSIREQGVMEARGIPMHLYYGFCKGDERASQFPEGIHCLPQSIPVCSQLVHAAGIGLALKKKGSQAVAIGFAGDGATSEGDFHEALNFAAVFGSQTLFYIQNNGWAISVHRSQQMRSETIAQKSHAYGMPGIQVDGNDVLAVYVAASQALEHIRAGKGPYLIEAHTYRMGSHTTADDAQRYRDPKELEYWEARDPIARMRNFLRKKGLWTDAQEEQIKAGVIAEAEQEVNKLEAKADPPPSDIFDYHYDQLTPILRQQRESLLHELGQSSGNQGGGK